MLSFNTRFYPQPCIPDARGDSDGLICGKLRSEGRSGGQEQPRSQETHLDGSRQYRLTASWFPLSDFFSSLPIFFAPPPAGFLISCVFSCLHATLHFEGESHKYWNYAMRQITWEGSFAFADIPPSSCLRSASIMERAGQGQQTIFLQEYLIQTKDKWRS